MVERDLEVVSDSRMDGEIKEERVSSITGPGPTVYIQSDGNGPSGMANMIGELIDVNIESFVSRRLVASILRGGVVLKASDREQVVTVTFKSSSVVICDGRDYSYGLLEAQWLTLAALASGRKSPFKAFKDNEVNLTSGDHKIRNLISAGGTGFIISVPLSFYGEKRVDKKVITVSIVSALFLTGVVAYSKLRRHKDIYQMSED